MTADNDAVTHIATWDCRHATGERRGSVVDVVSALLADNDRDAKWVGEATATKARWGAEAPRTPASSLPKNITE